MAFSLPPDKEYFSIGEVCRLTGVKPYVLRYWERPVGLLRPARRDSGQRKFTRKDVETVLQVRELLYDKRFTLEGARRHLRQQARRGPAQLSLEFAEATAAVQALREIKKDVADLLRDLRSTDVAPAGGL